MPLPQRPVVALSLVAAYYTARASSIGTFVTAFVAAYVLQAATYAVYAVFVYPHWVSPLRHLPQPTAGNHFLLGQFRRIAREPTGQPAADWINSILGVDDETGLLRYLGLFNSERLVVAGPRALAEVLVSRCDDFGKPRVLRDALRPVLGGGSVGGEGLLLAEGAAHRWQRKQLAPAFGFRHVKDLQPVFWRKGRESAEAMALHESLDVSDWSSRTTLDIIGVAGLGRDFGAVRDPANELAATYRVMLRTDGRVRLQRLLGLVLPRRVIDLLPFRRNADIAAANAYIKGVCRTLITEKRRQQQQTEKTDILSVALQSGGFSDDNLVAQLMTFLAAGHETTSAALTWAVYLLCVHPDVQERLRGEIRGAAAAAAAAAVSSSSSTSPSSSSSSTNVDSDFDVDRLPYLQAVCSEVLRYMAPVPFTMREARVDTTLQGQRVPRGTLVMLVPWAVNRSKALWGPSATEFDPERWLSGAPLTSNYAFLTFLHGPRSCIGMGFARAEFACVLAAWVGRLAFRLADAADADEAHLDITGTVSSRPRHGLRVCVRRLDDV